MSQKVEYPSNFRNDKGRYTSQYLAATYQRKVNMRERNKAYRIKQVAQQLDKLLAGYDLIVNPNIKPKTKAA